jgi:hypothetical protein
MKQFHLALAIFWMTYMSNGFSQDKESGVETVSAKDKVLSLKSKNEMPRLTQTSKVPIFSPEFDWEDQKRIVRQLNSVSLAIDDELWPELVKNLCNDDYCITYDVDNGETVNSTVGGACENLILATLVTGYYGEIQPPSKEALRDLRRPAEVGSVVELENWLSKNSGLRIYELQILMCRSAIEKLLQPKIVPSVSAELKQSWINSIKERIKMLEESKQHRRPNWFARGSMELYTEKDAASLRLLYQDKP